MNTLTIPKLTIEDPEGNMIVSKRFDCCGELKDGVFHFAPLHWAPGVFAGTEGMTLLIDKERYKIQWVDLTMGIIGVVKQ